ncbi:MAG: creatininase family protein [Gemmatimonadetes bacterium]|nr:creatininase family protein [Gemmatimonadota bacterium]
MDPTIAGAAGDPAAREKEVGEERAHEGAQLEWGGATWQELAELGLGPGRERTGVVALLPVGAVEAHGPHLPLETDVVIAEAAARAAVPGIASLGLRPAVLPALPYTAAPFAAGFAGTISLRRATVAALLADVAASLQGQGGGALVVVNAHLDPDHLGSIRDAVGAHSGPMPFIHPDLTERRWALRLGDEFRSGACHAGRYESSIVMAAAPELVRDEARRQLPENPASLSRAIGEGKRTFEEAGVTDAYCGAPAAATREEGEATIAELGRIVVETVADRLVAQ